MHGLLRVAACDKLCVARSWLSAMHVGMYRALPVSLTYSSTFELYTLGDDQMNAGSAARIVWVGFSGNNVVALESQISMD
jgi:hypothetical protein